MRSQLVCSGYDVRPIKSQLAEHKELWGQNSLRKNSSKVHQEMNDIWVRYNDVSKYDEDNMHKFNNEHIPIWYAAIDKCPALRKPIFYLMSKLEGEMLGGVLITKIPPGGKILPHADTGWHVNYFAKFYLSINSARGAVFSFQDEGAPESTREDVRPRTGDIYYIDNRKRHWVENNSMEDRVTMIICIRTRHYGGYS